MPQLGVPVHVSRIRRLACGGRECGKVNTPLAFGTSVAGDQRILTVEGELDMSVSAVFERALLKAVAATAPGSELLVDLRGVRFFDVNALRAFLSGADAASAAHVPLRLAASPHVDRVFEVLGIDVARPECPLASVDAGNGYHDR